MWRTSPRSTCSVNRRLARAARSLAKPRLSSGSPRCGGRGTASGRYRQSDRNRCRRLRPWLAVSVQQAAGETSASASSKMRAISSDWEPAGTLATRPVTPMNLPAATMEADAHTYPWSVVRHRVRPEWTDWTAWMLPCVLPRRRPEAGVRSPRDVGGDHSIDRSSIGSGSVQGLPGGAVRIARARRSRRGFGLRHPRDRARSRRRRARICSPSHGARGPARTDRRHCHRS